DPAKVPRRDALEVVPTPVDPDRSPSGGFARADINADWRFTVGGLSGPRRLQVLRTPPGWMMKAIRLDGTDITDAVLPLGAADQSVSGVEVVLTDRVTQVGGTVTDDRGVGMPDVSVILFGFDRDRWYSGSRFLFKSRSGSDGTFSMTGVPAGSYYTAAVRSLPDDGEDGW